MEMMYVEEINQIFHLSKSFLTQINIFFCLSFTVCCRLCENIQQIDGQWNFACQGKQR